jgi:uncharacterized protein with PIN domain
MIVVDSSALVAILQNEPAAAVYAQAIEQAERLLIPGTKLEFLNCTAQTKTGRRTIGTALITFQVGQREPERFGPTFSAYP